MHRSPHPLPPGIEPRCAPNAKLQAPSARVSRSYLRAATKRDKKTESRIRERFSFRGYAALQKRETGRPWPKHFPAWRKLSVISETLKPRGTTTQTQRHSIGRSGRRRDSHTRSGTKRMCCGKSAGPRKPNHSIRKLRVSTGSRARRPRSTWRILCGGWLWRPNHQPSRMHPERSGWRHASCMPSARRRQALRSVTRKSLHNSASCRCS
jgi:hypothetical protein